MTMMLRIQTMFTAIRRHPWRTTIVAIIMLAVGVPVFFLTREGQPEFIIAQARKGNLVQTVEAVGTVSSDRDLKLQFGATGIVGSVAVQEGMRVFRGQVLAALRADEALSGIAAEQANVAYLDAQYRAILEGTRPEDIAIARAQYDAAKATARPEEIAIARADVDAKQASLIVAETSLKTAESSLNAAASHLMLLKNQENTALAGLVLNSRSTVQQQLLVAENGLSVMHGVLNDVKVQEAMTIQRPELEAPLRSMKIEQEQAIASLKAKVDFVTDVEEALTIFQNVRATVAKVATTLDQSFSLLSVLAETQYFSNTVRQEKKDTIASQRTALQAALSSLDTAYRALQDAAASYAVQIQSDQSAIIAASGTRDKARADIVSFQAALNAAQAQLKLKLAGPRGVDIAIAEAELKAKEAPSRKTDIDAALARLRQAQAQLGRVRAQYSHTIIASPVDGIVSKVHVKVGEALPTGPAIEILGDTALRVEMFAAEVDVPRVQIGQEASMQLDAFPGREFALQVVQIDPGFTLVDGANKYRIVLNFTQPYAELKIGMTGDVSIVTGKRADVVSVPFKAVIEKDGKKIVRIPEGSSFREVPVETGLENDADVEILSGLLGTETVILRTK